MEWSGVEWSGVEWSGVEGVEWSGVEWSGVEWSRECSLLALFTAIHPVHCSYFPTTCIFILYFSAILTNLPSLSSKCCLTLDIIFTFLIWYAILLI